MKKLKTLITLSAGAGTCLFGYNLYNGDYGLYSSFITPFIHSLFPNAEKGHVFAIKAARFGLVPRVPEDLEIKSYLKTTLWGIDFDNPIGLAAGFDKDGEAIEGLSRLGFGFLEIGTTTPQPQLGNPFPRVFRLSSDRAVINRYGFNSLGHDEVEKNLQRQESFIKKRKLIIGLNLGKNRKTQDDYVDYIEGLQRFHNCDLIRYFVINVSCPNTPNLTLIQNSKKLDVLLDKVLQEKKKLQTSETKQKLLLLKLSPDLTDEELKNVSQVLMKYSKASKSHCKLDGLIISNTTIKRPETLKSSTNLKNEVGGLSGAPLKNLSTEAIRKVYKLTNGSIPIIGVGGIETGIDAYEKIKAGASLIQLYTSMVYFGPTIVREIKFELSSVLEKNGFKNVSEAVGKEDLKYLNSIEK